MNKYLVYDNEDQEYEMCETETEAQNLCDKWIKHSYDHNDGFSQEVMNGAIGYAKIVAESHFTETDNRKNYRCLHEDKEAECSICKNSINCDKTEEWYMQNHDFIGEVTLKKVEDEVK